MSDFSLTLVLQIKTSKIINDMAKIPAVHLFSCTSFGYAAAISSPNL